MNSAKKVVIGGILFVVIGFAALLMLGIFIASRQSNDQVSSAVTIPASRDEVFKLVNDERIKVGVAPLKMDERLNQSAQQKADDMAKYDYTEHINPLTGKHGYSYANDTGIVCEYVSENIFSGDQQFISASESVKSWMESESHRKAILNPDNSLTGVGIATGSHGKVYQVQHFCDNSFSKKCDDVTSYDYNWNNDMLCVREDGTKFYTDYNSAKKFLAK